ncbi:glycoside hydrolase family 2 TIM barrel-domain containing protein [Lacticaseibacillus suilingensis]|jgi:beta-galactosidase|uniref:beta-galactosidase n=1 Tax=Lacticaseibacillus suilingensis TaxID=2799577 RepID=A0ABW4BI65_9LACO|nr:glycoside hydrolase family 2 TIM barrel-domain containing protein [Lacticaseibacillus suilingensis]MCI1895284.1 beta-galactosidase [Lactobacillus sp.]
MTPKLQWLDDPSTFRINQLPAHSDHITYRNEKELQQRQSSLRLCLDGQWRFHFAKSPLDRPTGFEATDYDDRNWDYIKVPQHIALAGYDQLQYINTLYPWAAKMMRRAPGTVTGQDTTGMFSAASDNAVGSYRRVITLPAQWKDLDVHIQFAGVEAAMYLWVNGQFVGYAEDSFTPSEFDLTPFLTRGENLIAVQVYKYSTASFIEDQDFFRFFGIFRSVELLALPAAHLTDLALNPVSSDSTIGQVKACLQVTPVTQRIHAQIFDQAGALCEEATVEAKQKTEFQLKVVNPIQWSHEVPYLYTIILTLFDSTGQVTEVIPYDFGFRNIIIQNRELLLNQKRLILTGVNRHEWNCHTGRAISLTDMRSDLEVMKANHINAVRTCHYPDQLAWYSLCDQAGIYVMAEVNMESHGSWVSQPTKPQYNVPGSLPEWLPCVLDRAKTVYETLKNHTSILFWSLGNESYAGDDIQAMNDYFKSVDQSRPVHYEGVAHNRAYASSISDFESQMYTPPEELEPFLASSPKPVMLCEYMHSMGNSVGGLGQYMELIKDHENFVGGFIWDFIDQALLLKDTNSTRPQLRYGGDFDDRPNNGAFSGDGLLFADRTPKPALQEVAYYYGQFTK